MDNTYRDTSENIDDLKNEIKHLKEENARTKRNLMWKIRKIEKEKLQMEMEKNRVRIEVMGLYGELKILKGKIEKYRNIESVRNTMKFIRNDDYLIAYSQFIDDNGKNKDLILIKNNNDEYALLFHC